MRRSISLCAGLILAGIVSLAMLYDVPQPALGATQAQPSSTASLLAQGARPRMELRPVANTVAAARLGPPFQTMTSPDGLLVIHYYGLGQADVANVLSIAETSLASDTAHTGLKLIKAANVYIYPTRADFLAYANVQNPAETGAITYVATSEVYTPYYGGVGLDSVLTHEMTHVLLHQQSDEGKLDFRFFPNWLDEGLAESDVPPAGDDGRYDDSIFAQAHVNGSLLDIFRTFVWNYPSTVDEDNLSYAEARAFMLYLRATYGQTAFSSFVSGLVHGDYSTASINAFGHDILFVQNQWRTYVGLHTVDHSPVQQPTEPAPTPFVMGKFSGVEDTTVPVAINGGDVWLTNGLIVFACLLGAVMFVLGVHELILFFARRRRSVPQLDAQQRSPREVRAHAWQIIALILAPTLALGAGLLTTKVDSSFDWYHPFIAAAIVLGGAVATSLGLLVSAVRRRASWTPFLSLAILLLAGGIASLVTGRYAVAAEGEAYYQQSAYALATQRLAEGGASGRRLGEVYSYWGDVASRAFAYDEAVSHHLRALQLLPQGEVRAAALKSLHDETLTWAEGLRGAQQFQHALQVYVNLKRSGYCDAACGKTVDDERGDTYLALTRHLIITGDTPGAHTTLHTLSSDLPNNAAATSAKLVLTAAANPFAGLAATQSDSKARDLLALMVVKSHANDEQAQIAGELPVTVHGYLADYEVTVTPEHVWFFAFATPSAGTAFIYQGLASYPDDTSLFKVSAVADSKGQFSAQLPAGYFYVPVWATHGPNGEPGYFYFDRHGFAVESFSTAHDVGTLRF